MLPQYCTFCNYKQIERMDQPNWEKFESILQEEQQSTMSDFRRKSQYGKDNGHDNAYSRLETLLRFRKSECISAMQQKRVRMFKEVISIWLKRSEEMLQVSRFFIEYIQYKQCRALDGLPRLKFKIKYMSLAVSDETFYRPKAQGISGPKIRPVKVQSWRVGQYCRRRYARLMAILV